MSEPGVAAPDQDQVPQTTEFKGEQFRLNDDVSEWAFMEFAEAADAGQDAATLTGMASLLRFVLELVHPDDRDRFRSLARRTRASSEDLMEFLLGKTAEDAERPTVPPSDSSDGPTVIEPKSDANSGDRDSAPTGLELVRQRPDLAPFIDQAMRSAS